MPSMLALAGMYVLGAGVGQSDTDAADWFRKAADAGNDLAMYNLGRFYEDGTGVTQNSGTAKQFYEHAAKLGNKEAVKRLSELH